MAPQIQPQPDSGGVDVSELDELYELPPDKIRFLIDECGQAIAALKGGTPIEELTFDEYVEYVSLKDYLEIAREGYDINPKEVQSWGVIRSWVKLR